MKVAIGTAQFGLDYGISNSGGKVSLEEVRAILALAKQSGVCFLDTASAYGDSESVLGLAMGEGGATFQVITKTRRLEGGRVSDVIGAFSESLERLRKKSVYGILVHSANDLLGSAGEQLFSELLELKREGKVQKVGVSVYDSKQIEEVFKRFPIEIIQVPLNLLDQRLKNSGHLALLKKRKIEIHARSVFLQGLLLMPLEKVPLFLSPVLPILKKYQTVLQSKNVTLLEGALLYVQGLTEIDYCVLGVCSAGQLGEILRAKQRVENMPADTIDFANFGVDRLEVLNPALWGAKKD